MHLQVCITRAVFMGLLKRAAAAEEGNDPSFFVQLRRSDDNMGDGTIFIVRDLNKVCVALVKAWGMLNVDPSKFDSRLDTILNYLNGKKASLNLSLFASDEQGTTANQRRKKNDEPAEWSNFKASVKEAQVQ